MPDIRLTVSERTLARLDEVRGRVPRVRWIRDLIEASIRESVETAERTTVLPTVEGPDPECPLGWKPRPGTARCFNCGRSMSRHEVSF
jgi:hypothetical protein